ncbi:hypothetical protein TWF569_008833 [Orbilia oligospora]|uniref:Carboxylic ester hydrolase n=1 Tax=Orbilia oligospora TaxID=2813651 RepID=A0A7C8JWF4_ORBOL|nr:hypothetical protein TWF594_001204 [Orbilia oligospora]KAF3135844.1 hypothetical protein TWF703_005940 [Orbilia oligospora]KAF3138337.1 hypothetical protein TWF569_008833 [Orbilia oligospora]
MRIASLFSIAAAFATTFAQLSSNLTLITEDFGENPTNVPFYLYVPKTVQRHPAIVLGVHWCTGTGPVFFENTEYAKYADQFGYIVIYPSAPRESKCWDVASNATLTHNGGSDSLALANMVRWTLKKYHGDPNRVFVTGLSSGGMMTQVLVATYPDLFKAGSSYCGVPYGCFRGPSEWNNVCSGGRLIKTPKQWGDDVRNAYPGYRGPRPKLQIWHGSEDVGLAYQNFHESNKMWSNVFKIEFKKNNTNTPFANYTQMVFGDGTKYIAYSAAGIGHDIKITALDVLAWFGIYKARPTTTATTTGLSAPTSTVLPWGQCGGITYKGPITCGKTFWCKQWTNYFSQCIPKY